MAIKSPSTNLLNKQIMGAYRRHNLSLNAPSPASPSAEPDSLPSSHSTNSLQLQHPQASTTTTTTTSSTTTSTDLLPTSKRKLAIHPPSLQLQPQCSPITSSKRSKPSTSKTAPSNSLSKSTHPSLSLADLGGIDSTVEKLLELIGLPILHPEIFAFTGLKPIRGLLLCGPPGCGKTMLAHAVANQLGVRLLSVSSTSIVSGMSGESEKAIRDIFEQATKQAPCLLFMDEIDAITPKRETAQREMERRIVAQLLTCLDDLSLDKTDGKPVIVIGATNRPDSLDPALRRGGRFDHEILMGIPDERAREQILRVLCAKLKLVDSFDYKRLARATPGYVGADLTALTASAGVIAIKRVFEPEPAIEKPEEDAMAIDASHPPTDLVPEDSILPTEPDPDTEADGQQGCELFENLPSHLLSLPIISFLRANPHKLSTAQLERIRISQEDFSRALRDFQPSCKREGFSTIPDTTWAEIGAMGSVREELNISIIQPIRYPEMFAQIGIASSFGVLLWGPPGCGKTLVAKAVANESQANFISVKGPELLNKYVGESEKAVRQVFVRARASAPCIIFFDELDALVPRRDDSLSESSSRVVNTLLTELDGLEPRRQIYVIGATNRPDVLDPAMVRPGRLDKMIFIDLPDGQARWEIFKTLAGKLGVGTPAPLETLIRERCEGYSGADVGALIREAALVGLRGQIEKGGKIGEPVAIGISQFEDALDRVRPSVSAGQQRRYRSLHARFNGVPPGMKVQEEEQEKIVTRGKSNGMATSA